MTLTAHIETVGAVKQHPFHLGTDVAVAETFVRDFLRRQGVRSVALRRGAQLVRIYDWRDLQDSGEALL